MEWQNMEWQEYTTNVYINESKTVVISQSLKYLPKFSFSGNLEDLDKFAVISRVEGKGIIKEFINNKPVTISSMQVIKMTSKFGNVSYFDADLITQFIKDSSMLYLPQAEPKGDGFQPDAPVIITNTDVIFVVMPYAIDEFIEEVSLDDWF